MSDNSKQIRTTWLVDGDPVTAVIEMASVTSGTPITELPALTSYVDVDALDTLLSRRGTNISITFTYEGYVVEAGSIGDLTLTEQPDAGANTLR